MSDSLIFILIYAYVFGISITIQYLILIGLNKFERGEEFIFVGNKREINYKERRRRILFTKKYVKKFRKPKVSKSKLNNKNQAVNIKKISSYINNIYILIIDFFLLCCSTVGKTFLNKINKLSNFRRRVKIQSFKLVNRLIKRVYVDKKVRNILNSF